MQQLGSIKLMAEEGMEAEVEEEGGVVVFGRGVEKSVLGEGEAWGLIKA